MKEFMWLLLAIGQPCYVVQDPVYANIRGEETSKESHIEARSCEGTDRIGVTWKNRVVMAEPGGNLTDPQ